MPDLESDFVKTINVWFVSKNMAQLSNMRWNTGDGFAVDNMSGQQRMESELTQITQCPHYTDVVTPHMCNHVTA